MRRKLIILGLLFSMFLFFMIVREANAATVCSITVNGTAVSDNLVLDTESNLTLAILRVNVTDNAVNHTYLNITRVDWNFTRTNSTQFNFSDEYQNATGSIVNNSLNITADLVTLNESVVNLTVYVFNTSAGGTSNTTFCTVSNTGLVIDYHGIAIPTINGPADNARVTSKTTAQVFNVSSARNGEQIKDAVLYLGPGNTYTMTTENVLATTFSTRVTNPAAYAYTWYVLVTDTDGTTTARSAERKIQFDYSQGTGNQLPPELLPQEPTAIIPGKNPLLLLAIAVGAYLILRKKTKRVG